MSQPGEACQEGHGDRGGAELPGWGCPRAQRRCGRRAGVAAGAEVGDGAPGDARKRMRGDECWGRRGRIGIPCLAGQWDSSGVPLRAGNLRWGGVELSEGIGYWREGGSALGAVGTMSEENARRAQAFRPESTRSNPVARARELVAEAAATASCFSTVLRLRTRLPSRGGCRLRRDCGPDPGGHGCFTCGRSLRGRHAHRCTGVKGQRLVTQMLRADEEAGALPMSDTYENDATLGARHP